MDGAGDPGTWPPWNRFGHWDVLSGTPRKLEADAIANSFGWRTHIEITSFDSLPVAGVPGVEILCYLNHDAEGHRVTITKEWVENAAAWQWDRDGLPIAGGYTTTVTTPGFPYAFSKIGDWAMSDCFLFPRAAAGPTAFAAFNNLDASVIFDAFTTNTSNRWKLQFDVRLRDTDDCCVLGRTNNFSRRALLSSTRFLWFSVGTTIDPPLPLNEFGTVRVEWDWDTPGLFFNVWWNDVLRGTEAAFFANGLRFNVMGKSGATFVGDFDMLNLTLEDNNPGSPNLMLSTELQVDACDIGVKMLKGTTENMTLPSCP